jgi:transcriptional regulator with XRE-family HTH domain
MQSLVITSSQIRAGRALLRWSAIELARASGVSIATIKRVELEQGVPSISVPLLSAIRSALEGAGVEFVGEPKRGPGVRLGATAIPNQPRPRGIRKK